MTRREDVVIDVPLVTKHIISLGSGEIVVPAGSQLSVVAVIEEGDPETWGLLHLPEPDMVVGYRVVLTTDTFTMRQRGPHV